MNKTVACGQTFPTLQRRDDNNLEGKISEDSKVIFISPIQ